MFTNFEISLIQSLTNIYYYIHNFYKSGSIDQSATTCSSNEVLGGDIEGPYIQGNFVLPTKTELVGQDNALLYQVFVPGDILGKT